MGKIFWLIARAQWDRAIAIIAALVALLALVFGWIGVASTEYPAEQVPYVVSGGIFGIMLVALAATLWISADMRDEWRKLDEVSSKLDEVKQGLRSVDRRVPASDDGTEEMAGNGAARSRRASTRTRRTSPET